MQDHSKLGSMHYRNVELLLLASPKQIGSVVLSLVLLMFGGGEGANHDDEVVRLQFVVKGSKLMLWLVVHMTVVWGSPEASKMKGCC